MGGLGKHGTMVLEMETFERFGEATDLKRNFERKNY